MLVCPQVEKKKSAKESEFGARPMTEQEKKEYMRENEAKLRREGKLPKVGSMIVCPCLPVQLQC